MDYDPFPLYHTVYHFEQLFRIYVFLGINTNNEEKMKDYLLDAFFFIMKIFEISFDTLNVIDFYEKNKEEITKFNLEGGNQISSMINHYFTTKKELNFSQVYTLPDSLENWISYDFPPIFKEKIPKIQEKTFFCKTAFNKPFQTFCYLRYILDKFMNELYFHTECIPLLKFMILFSEYILESNDLKLTYILKLKRLYSNIINENENEIIGKNELFNINFNSWNFNNDIKIREREELRKFDLNLNTEENFIYDTNDQDLDGNSHSLIFVDNLKIHTIWIDQAYELFNFGVFNLSKDLIDEAIFHCLVLKDKFNYISAIILLAKIYFIEANFEQSFSLYNKIQIINQNFDTTLIILYDICYLFDFFQKYDDLVNYLENFLVFLNKYYYKN